MKLKLIDYTYFLFILALIFIYFSFYPLNVDATWILHSAQMMIEDSILYVDIIDVNPPLIFIYTTLAVFINNMFGLSLDYSFILLVITLICISSFLSFNIIKKLFTNDNSRRYYLYSIIFILSISMSYNFGEREHLFILFIFPYFLSMVYKNKVDITFSLKLIVGILASLGFNLKPHFFLIFIGIELIFMLNKKDFFSFLRIDSITIILSSILYIFIVYFYFPEYLSFMIPFAIETYSDVFNKPFSILIITYEIIFFVLLLIFFLLSRSKFNYENILFITCILISIIIYLVQQKGWAYHRFPVFSLSLLFLAHLSFYHKKYTIYSILFIPLILITIQTNIRISVFHYKELQEIVNNLNHNDTVLIVSTDIGAGQALLKSGQTWASRFPCLFMLPSIWDNNKKNDKIKEYTFNSIYEDLVNYNPDIIIFPSNKYEFDYFDYLKKEDSRLKNFYKKYTKIDLSNNYIVLKNRVKE